MEDMARVRELWILEESFVGGQREQVKNFGRKLRGRHG